MKIKEFSELTQFIYDEYSKMSENFGTQQPSESFIKYTEKTLEKYTKVYDKPLFKQTKRDAELMEALNTRPHNWIWKLFHNRLWAKIKEIEKQEKIDKERKDKLEELDFERIKKELSTPPSPPGAVLVPTWIESNAQAPSLESGE